MAISYQGKQYREDGAPLDASGNVVSGSWINPNYAYDGGILTDSSGTRFDVGSIGANGGMQIRPDAQFGAPAQSQNLGMGATGYAPPGQLQPAPGYGTTTPPAPQPSPQMMGATGGGNLGFTQNPYLTGMADEIGRRSQQQLGQSFNQIRSNSIGVGGLGGSRQGVAEGVATGLANDAYSGNMASLFGNQYNTDANRQLSRYGMDQNFYTAQRGQDQSGAALGASLMTQGQQGQWGPINQANQTYSPYTGLGTTTQSGSTGGGANGALGGALAGSIMSKYMGLGGSGGGSGMSTVNGPGNPNNMYNGVDTNGWWS